MTPDQAVDIVRQALMTGLLIAAPILGVGLAIGLVISILQAVTQIQEQTLTFVPKIAAMAGAAIVIIPWAYVKMAEFAGQMFAP